MQSIVYNLFSGCSARELLERGQGGAESDVSEKGVYCLTRPISLNYPNPLTTKKLQTLSTPARVYFYLPASQVNIAI